MQIRELTANNLTFRVREHGEGVPVLLLHGFPETSAMWEPLMERLAGEGFHCLAPDQRGYSPGARPADVEEYAYSHLAADIVGFMDAMGWERAHVIGHDWGAGAGWVAVDATPGRFLSWVPMSVPHIAAFAKAIRENDDQKQMSGYIQFFLQAGAAEGMLLGNDLQALRDIFKDSHSAPEVDDYVSVFSQEGALTAALNWYRASAGFQAERDGGGEFGPVSTPTLHFWGRSDAYIGRDATLAGAPHMTGPYDLIELDCGHWIVQEKLDEVVGPLVAHLKKYS